MIPDNIGKQPGTATVEEDASICQAYPLMDAVASAEGWDDPEMDSYDACARPPQPRR